MKNVSRHAVLFFAILFFPVASHGADAVKLKPVAAAYTDNSGGLLKRPEGVAYDGKSLLVVADTGNGRLQLYTFTGSLLMPGAAIALPQLSYPIRVQIGSKGEILALDGKSRRIVRVSPSGEFKGYVEPTGIPSAGTVIPRSFKIDDKDNLYLLDVFSGRVLILDPDGRFQREIPFPDNFGFFSDLAVDGNGTVFLIDSVGGKVFIAQKNAKSITPLTGSLKEDLNFPVGQPGAAVCSRSERERNRHPGAGWFVPGTAVGNGMEGRASAVSIRAVHQRRRDPFHRGPWKQQGAGVFHRSIDIRNAPRLPGKMHQAMVD